MINTRIFTTLYYLLFSYTIYQKKYQVISFNYSKQVFSWLNIYPTDIKFSFESAVILFYVLLGLTLLSAVLQRKALSFIVFALTYIFYSFLYSLGKINHSDHAWIISSFLICFIDRKSQLKSAQNILTLRLIQCTLLSHYFFSGVWKLRGIENRFSFSTYKDTALEHISYAIAEGSIAMTPLLKDYIAQYSWVFGIGLVLVITFQVSSIIPIIFDRFYLAYGVFATLFHCMTAFILGISFTSTMIAVLYLLIAVEITIKGNYFNSSPLSGK